MAIVLSGKHRKFVEHLKTKPKTVEWKDVESLFHHLGYVTQQGGTSHVLFAHATLPFLHTLRPHPRKTIIHWQIKEILAHLNKLGL
ncbi:MAG: type II toxin-antitoxin system HicA family toxin [Planctomycetes bacterium]|nr:type II toxin-antitoxin system HicA family toxin [Planctomycetota bacterium]